MLRHEASVNQTAFSAARHTGNAGQNALGNAYTDVFQVVDAGILYKEELFPNASAATGRLLLPLAKGSRRRGVGIAKSCRGSVVDDVAALASGSGSHFDHPLGAADDFGIVFDDEYAVAPVPKLTKEFYKTLCITRMQTNARLV